MHHFISTLAAAAVIRAATAQPFELRGRKDVIHHEADAASVAEPPNPAVFEPAKNLDHFANLDPKQFEWVNPDEIQPGKTTCGFLTAPFGSDANGSDVVYPKVRVCKQWMFQYFSLPIRECLQLIQLWHLD